MVANGTKRVATTREAQKQQLMGFSVPVDVHVVRLQPSTYALQRALRVASFLLDRNANEQTIFSPVSESCSRPHSLSLSLFLFTRGHMLGPSFQTPPPAVQGLSPRNGQFLRSPELFCSSTRREPTKEGALWSNNLRR